MVAEKGVTGAIDVLEGPAGMGVAMSGSADWSKATAGLGSQYNIKAMTFKNHGCCGHNFAAIDGALELKKRHNLTPDKIKSIHVGSYQPAYDICYKPDPQSQFECRFSMPYTVCTGLVYGKVRLAAFEPERRNDPAVRDLMKRFTQSVDAELDAAFPAQRAARVTIVTTDGEELTFLQPTRKGDPDQPLTDDELADKFSELAGAVLPQADAKALLSALWSLETVADLHLPGAVAALEGASA
jgi:2-methylcitrate dehydratase PrpD